MTAAKADQPAALRIDFNLLDRQIVDSDGNMIGNVDDVELDMTGPNPRVVALLVGQQALGDRIGGALGRWMAGAARRLAPHPDTPPIRVPYDLVASVGSDVVLRVTRDLLPEPPLETWLRQHLIDRIPGANRESQ
jgi:sporulation protein YlmC with PRC-barrel domain